LTASPQKVSEGQPIDITMTVTNVGGSTIVDVFPSTLTVKGLDGLLELSSSFERETIEQNQSKRFTWTYTPPEGSAGKGGTNTITFSGYAGNEEIKSGPCEVEVTIEKPAALSSKIDVEPTLSSEGQEITVTMTVVNNGKATAKEVAPSMLALSGKVSKESGPTLRDGPKPTKADIPSGGSREFIWRYTTTSGDVTDGATFAGNAKGIDVNSGKEVSSIETTSPKVTIQTPAKLEVASLTAEPAQISEGQIITLNMMMKNSGQAAAIDITPSAPEFMMGRLINPMPQGPNPAKIDELREGDEQTFTWTFQTQGKDENHPVGDAGKVIFEIRATGRDNNSKKLIQSDKRRSNEVQIQIPAKLEVELKPDHQTVSSGKEISGAMIVTNTGEAKAIEVQLKSLSVQVSSEKPQPITITQEPVEIEGGEAKEFSWSYTAPDKIKEKVQVFFDGIVVGKDGNSQKTIEATAQRVAVTIIPRSSLVISGFDVSPKQITEGQFITVTMIVRNIGEATVTNVKASVIVQGSGKATFESGPADEGKTIKPGSEQIYIWRYSTIEGAAGDITFTGHAEGIDELSGEPTPQVKKSSNVIIQRPAHLVVSKIKVERERITDNKTITEEIDGEIKNISEGQKIIVTLTVKNDGGAKAIQVTPSLELAGTSNLKSKAPYQTPPSITVDLEGGGKRDFVWVYQTQTQQGSRPGDVGTVKFIADARGYDENTRKFVQSEKVISTEVTIQIPARLDATLEAKPETISEGQSITVTMTVKNIGQATALNVTAPEKLEIVGRGERATLVSQQVVKELSRDKSIQFQWIYATTSGDHKIAGTILFQGKTEGVDENTGLTVYSNTTASNFVTIQRPASLR